MDFSDDTKTDGIMYHLEISLDIQDFWRSAAFVYRQQNIASMLPEHLAILDSWSSLEPSHG